MEFNLEKLEAVFSNDFSSSIFVILADYYIIPKYSIIGAAQVLLTAHIILNIIYLYFTYKEYGTIFLMKDKRLK